MGRADGATDAEKGIERAVGVGGDKDQALAGGALVAIGGAGGDAGLLQVALVEIAPLVAAGQAGVLGLAAAAGDASCALSASAIPPRRLRALLCGIVVPGLLDDPI